MRVGYGMWWGVIWTPPERGFFVEHFGEKTKFLDPSWGPKIEFLLTPRTIFPAQGGQLCLETAVAEYKFV